MPRLILIASQAKSLVVEKTEPFEGMSGQINLIRQAIVLGEITTFGLLLKIMILKVMNGEKEHILR